MKYLKTKNKPGPKVIDYTGYKVGKLTVLYREKKRWVCECECGERAYARTKEIKNQTRLGCRSCTASLVSVRKNQDIEHYGYKKRLYREYYQSAKKRNIDFEITFDEFHNLILSNCIYCGLEPQDKPNKNYMVKTLESLKANGVDRFNNNIGYTSENSVACCSKCNYAKHCMDFDEFKDWITKVYLFLNKTK